MKDLMLKSQWLIFTISIIGFSPTQGRVYIIRDSICVLAIAQVFIFAALVIKSKIQEDIRQ